MIEALDLLWQFACRSWQLWGALAFVLAPAGLAVVAVWDFADWHKRKDFESGVKDSQGQPERRHSNKPKA
jgi:hypothetical protein